MKDHYVHRTVTSIADWDSSTFGSAIELVQLSPGKFHCEQEIVNLGDVLLLRLTINHAVSARGTGQTSRCVAVFFDQDQEGHFAGAPIRQNELILLPPFLEFDACAKSGTFGCTVIFADPNCVQEYLRALTGSELPTRPAHSNGVSSNGEIAGRLSLWSQRIFEAAKSDDRTLQQLEMRETMQDEALTMMVQALDSSTSTNLLPQSRFDKARKLVHRCEDFVIRSPDFRVRLIDLCRETEVSERTLQYAFQEILGVSPIHYLNQIRLHQVRRALSEASPQATTVSTEACRWGFWHFGEFTKAYKSLFDELPSETLSCNTANGR